MDRFSQYRRWARSISEGVFRSVARKVTFTLFVGLKRSSLDRFHLNDVQAPLITRARHRIHLENASRFLQAFLEACKSGP